MPAPSAKLIFDTHGVAQAKIEEPRSRGEQEGMLTHGPVVWFGEGGVATRGRVNFRYRLGNRLCWRNIRGKSRNGRKTTGNPRLGGEVYTKAFADDVSVRVAW